MELNSSLVEESLEAADELNSLEDKLAMEIFGCWYEDLDYDDKDYITCVASNKLRGEES